MSRPWYDISQCALYKVQSKARLASLLHVGVRTIVGLAKAPKYREFWIEATTCPFTGKLTKRRHVQTPAEALRPIHDRLLDLLRRVEPPSYAHAAIKGRSYRTNAASHTESMAASTFDLTSFYPSTSESAVFRFFADQMMCAPDIASLLAKLICVKAGTGGACLPTGSPLSPLVSIYANKPMFDGLDRFAKRHGLAFTCYVDDLTFSGTTLPIGLGRQVSSLVRRHGHTLAARKTRTFRVGAPKHITGVVVQSGRVSVPNARFQKARKIQMAIDLESERIEKIRLMQKLAGLLGEAAYLDPRYKSLAKKTTRSLANFRANSPAVTGPVHEEFLALGRLLGDSESDSVPF